MKYPARCNKRACQARKSFRRKPDEYKYPKKCHMPGCTGIMKLDKLRYASMLDPSLAVKDRGEVCNCDGYIGPHRKGQKNCIHHEEKVLNQAFTKGTFKHSPVKVEELTDYHEEPTW